MTSGRTHDRITLWILPVVAVLTFHKTQSGILTLLVSGGFLFAGLMFGPDLDIYSRQYQRWGFLRWIWIPYQKSLRHRSFLSHGPIIGTVLRSLYLSLWIMLLAWLGWFVVQWWGVGTTDGKVIAKLSLVSLRQYYGEWIALFIGLELGAMSHSLSDWSGSAFKRFKSSGFRAILPHSSKVKKPAVTKVRQRKLDQQTTKTPITRRKREV